MRYFGSSADGSKPYDYEQNILRMASTFMESLIYFHILEFTLHIYRVRKQR